MPKKYAGLDGTEPVSYTHLDVYKRQQLLHIGPDMSIIKIFLTFACLDRRKKFSCFHSCRGRRNNPLDVYKRQI